MFVICKRPTKADYDHNSRRFKQQNKTSLKRLVVNGKQKCLECGGIGQFIGNRISFLTPVNLPYNHKENCSMVGRF